MSTLFPLAASILRPDSITQPRYTGHTGKRRAVHACSLNYPRRGKYSRVRRALPEFGRAKSCSWRKVVTAGGRRILVPKG